MFSRRLLGLLMVTGLLGGCAASPDASGPLPDGTGLVREAAAALGELETVHFKFGISGILDGLEVLDVEGDASRAGGPHGSATGRAAVPEANDRVDYRFQLSGDALTLTDAEGATRTAAVPSFTPATLLDASRGLPHLLTGATALRTETKEKLAEVETYRIDGQVPRAVISAVVPSIQSDVDVKFWVERAATRNLARVWLQVPPRQANEGAVMLELALTAPGSGCSPAAGCR
ncbi:LppX_LprAFG lipoprotein [Amycolatopsis sp. 195334CR]|uniref:LppX_LprAFG lipoprotein n=1 Tax=Amycolatopsis sp. 195334CR TaxID=2814588 RepID=UPI001A90C865|nr:LppX_LprAFG lipoprotein [Amycolatopsis sp. 195334CR]MBN6034289.1 LppX_LprAFG lipoprotein [Amycolatopsis sp. 195334CR]